ncbi:MAG: DMT family transporter [Clostridia bacterium]|nr:DMT family transporter [Clostridia bacterium]
MSTKKQHSIAFYYILLGAVITTWGLDPIVNSAFYKYYSASLVSAICTFGSAVFFIIMSARKLKNLNMDYVKIALPITLLSALANLSQRIGLQYTTPANYAFLERLSIVIVPIVLYILTRKKPSALRIVASAFCLVGCFVFSGAFTDGFTFGIGEMLCSLAGILGGINLCLTGVYVKKLDISLYMTIYMSVYFLTSLVMTIGLNAITDTNGIPLEPLRYTASPVIFIALLLFGLFSVGLCWLMRTEAIKYISPAKVTLLNPLSAVLTGVVSISIGTDILSIRFVAGTLLILAAVFMSGIDGLMENNRNKPKSEEMINSK